MSKRSFFDQCALASGLLTAQQLDAARADLGPPTIDGAEPGDPQLAERLVAGGLLNAWQAKQLLDGRTKFTLGPYRIVDSIGQGGMGQVFKAEHSLSGHTVAIKVLPRDKSTPEAVANFTREIQALAKLDHRHLVRALDDGQDGNVYYLAIEFVPGTDLRKLVRRDGPLSMELAARIISQVAEALQHAHEQGIVHRDVKPGNVLVTPEGEAKLSDLGLAGPMGKDMEEDPRHGKIVGTVDYISPDHIASPGNPTPAWDIYSLGCTLYYAVTGKVPFPGGTTADKARAHCELRPLDPRRLNPRLSAEFVDVLAEMMAKDPAQRLQSAAQVIARLAPWVDPTARPQPASSELEGRWMSYSGGFPPPIIIPPPVLIAPLESSVAAAAAGSLRDTVTDVPTLAQHAESDSEELSVEVDVPSMIPLVQPLLLCIIMPLVLVGLLTFIAFLVKKLLS
ncbi:MAG: serine/threonine-protein kinase [Thermoguttaceae bacterium]